MASRKLMDDDNTNMEGSQNKRSKPYYKTRSSAAASDDWAAIVEEEEERERNSLRYNTRSSFGEKNEVSIKQERDNENHHQNTRILRSSPMKSKPDRGELKLANHCRRSCFENEVPMDVTPASSPEKRIDIRIKVEKDELASFESQLKIGRNLRRSPVKRNEVGVKQDKDIENHQPVRTLRSSPMKRNEVGVKQDKDIENYQSFRTLRSSPMKINGIRIKQEKEEPKAQQQLDRCHRSSPSPVKRQDIKVKIERDRTPINLQSDSEMDKPASRSSSVKRRLGYAPKQERSYRNVSFENVPDMDESLTSTPSKTASGSAKVKKEKQMMKSQKREIETDPEVLSRRQKQIDYGKNTLAYHRYLESIAKLERKNQHPVTPKKHMRYSRRSWDAQIKLWRKRLHHYDANADEDGEDFDLSDLASDLSLELDESISSRSSAMSPIDENDNHA